MLLVLIRQLWRKSLSLDRASKSILFASMRELDELISELWRRHRYREAEALMDVQDERVDRYERSIDPRRGDSGVAEDSE